MAQSNLFRKTKSLFASTLSTGIGTGTGDTITPASVSGLPTDTEITLTFDRVDSTGTATPDKMERITGTISGGSLTSYTRAVDGSTEQAHDAGAVIEYIPNADDINDMVDGILVEHGQDGTHDNTKVAMLAGEQTFTGAKTFTGGVAGALWAAVPGTPTRVSDTQFTITDTGNANSYDSLFKKGIVLKWLESTTFQIAMVISSSYADNTVTINIVGDSLTAGFTEMKYATQEALEEVFIIPGTLGTGTGLAKTWRNREGIYLISADAFVNTAGATGATTFDINDDGTTKFGTKPSIADTGTSDIDNVSTNPSTAVAKDSKITIDIDAVTTTAPKEAYIRIFYVPTEWRYR